MTLKEKNKQLAEANLELIRETQWLRAKLNDAHLCAEDSDQTLVQLTLRIVSNTKHHTRNILLADLDLVRESHKKVLDSTCDVEF